MEPPLVTGGLRPRARPLLAVLGARARAGASTKSASPTRGKTRRAGLPTFTSGLPRRRLNFRGDRRPRTLRCGLLPPVADPGGGISFGCGPAQRGRSTSTPRSPVRRRRGEASGPARDYYSRRLFRFECDHSRRSFDAPRLPGGLGVRCIGPGLIDLAMLTAGRWSAGERDNFAPGVPCGISLIRQGDCVIRQSSWLPSICAAFMSPCSGLAGLPIGRRHPSTLTIGWAKFLRCRTNSAYSSATTHESRTAMPPNRFLIVNADDFGLCQSVNEGIAAAHEKGIVTSASPMVRSAGAAAAVAYARPGPS